MEKRAPLAVAQAAEPALSVYEQMHDDIVQGRLSPNARLKIATLAEIYGTSTNPVREALQQLRGEGFVVITPNRGARVRPMDDAFISDLIEIEVLLEPHFTRWFVEIATAADIAQLEEIQAEIEAVGFADTVRYSALDTKFHRIFYDRHYNQHALDLWWRHREILSALSRHTQFASWREQAIINEHRMLIDCGTTLTGLRRSWQTMSGVQASTWPSKSACAGT